MNVVVIILKGRQDDRRSMDCGRCQWHTFYRPYPHVPLPSPPGDWPTTGRVCRLYCGRWVDADDEDHAGSVVVATVRLSDLAHHRSVRDDWY